MAASYAAWEYPSAAYDIVISSMIMHHLMPKEKLPVYKKIFDSLADGGFYIESDFIVDPPQAAQYRLRYEKITAAIAAEGSGDYHIDIPCTIGEELALFDKAGFGSAEVLLEDIRPRGSRAIIRANK